MSPILGTIASQVPGRLLPTTGFVSISTVTVGAEGASSVSFSNIPASFKHLQIRGVARATSGSQNAGTLRLNGDTSTNYTFHQLFSNGSNGSSNGDINSTWMYFQKVPGSSDPSNVYGAVTIDILEYANTSKNKVMRYLGGANTNGSGFIFVGSNAWYSTAPVSSLTLAVDGSTFAQHTKFALYGIQG